MAALSKVLVQVTEQSILRWMRVCERETMEGGFNGNSKVISNYSITTYTFLTLGLHTHKSHSKPIEHYIWYFKMTALWVLHWLPVCFLTQDNSIIGSLESSFAAECKKDEKKLWTQLSSGILSWKFLCRYMCLKRVTLFSSEGNVWLCMWRKSEAVNCSKNLPSADFYLTESDYWRQTSGGP